MIELAKITSWEETEGYGFYAVRVDSGPGSTLDPVGDSFLVRYTSPYWSLGEGGFLAPPQVGAIVLVTTTTNGGRYYLQSVTDPTSQSKTDSQLTRATGIPMRKSFKGDRGCGLEIYDELSKEMQNVGTGLVTGTGKYVKLIDSPGVDSVDIGNGLGDFIRLTREPKSGVMTGIRSLFAKVWGSLTLFCKTGRLLIQNQEGSNIDIINNSKGQYAPSSATKKNHGNVNIQSKHSDVNVYAEGKEGRIFIECLNKSSGEKNVIQFSTQGSGSMIRIASAGSVEIVAAEDLKLSAKGTVTFEGSNFEFNTGASTAGNDKSTFSDTGAIPV